MDKNFKLGRISRVQYCKFIRFYIDEILFVVGLVAVAA